MLIIMSGSAAAQAIGYALTPIISRLFSPSDFGTFGTFNSVAAIISAGATLEYSQSIMLPREKDDALNLFALSCISVFGIGLLFSVICIILPEVIKSLLRADGNFILIILVFSIIIAGLNRSFQAWCVRVKAFKQTSTSQVIRSISSNGSQIGFGLLHGGAPGLIISTVLADALASLNLIRVLIPEFLERRYLITWSKMKILAKEYVDFPMYSASQNVINALSSGIPVLLLTHFYGIAIAGAYAFGVRILQIPMGFVLNALRQVLFQKASETQHNGGDLFSLYKKITLGLFGIAFVPSLVLFIWAPNIFVIIFGDQWMIAGEYARYLVLWLLFAFCNVPAVLFAQLIRIQRNFFFYDLILLLGRISVLVFGGLYLSALQSVILFSFIGAIMNFILIFYVGRAVIKKAEVENLSTAHTR